MYDDARFLWPPGKSARNDRRLEDLREHLDNLKESQRVYRLKDLDLDDDDIDEWMAEQYQKHSHVIQAEGEWAERLRIRDKRAFVKEEAEWREMEAREQDKLQEDAIEAAGQMFDLAASNQPQDQLDEDQDNSELEHTAVEDGDDPLNKKGAEENSGMAKVSEGFVATDHPIDIPVPSNNHKAQGNIANKPSSLRNLGPRRSLEQATKSQATRLGPNSNSFPYLISQKSKKKSKDKRTYDAMDPTPLFELDSLLWFQGHTEITPVAAAAQREKAQEVKQQPQEMDS